MQDDAESDGQSPATKEDLRQFEEAVKRELIRTGIVFTAVVVLALILMDLLAR